MPTIHDVAKLAGVAPITVSRVINHSGYLSEKTRLAVEAAIAELGYVPNMLARSLRSKRTNTLALIITDITNPFFTTLARGVEDAASDAGFTLIFCNTDESQKEEDTYIQVLLQKQVDGIILVPARSTTQAVDLIQKHGTPVVVIDRYVDHSGIDIVRGDSLDGAYQLVRHLIEMGHHSIAAISGPQDVSTAADRIAGYSQAMQSNGLKSHEQIHYGQFTRDSGYQLTCRILQSTPRPTAIFCGNNFLIVGAMKAIREVGLRVPEDIALVGFDDFPESMVTFPFFTVAAQPAYDMGQQATRILLARLNNIDEPYQEVVLPCEIIIRESSGKHHTER